MKRILITGGLGFIGSHLVEHFTEFYPNYLLVVLDAETYAADLDFKDELLNNEKFKNVKYYYGDIRDQTLINTIFNVNNIDNVIHLAAESHVDNSIENPNIFADVNVLGTMNLLNHAVKYWTGEKGKGLKNPLFYHVSTDEVYGALDEYGYFEETTAYDPKSPYSASKAASDHMVRAYGNTYSLPFVISNCSNNYGPRQHAEKLIPKTITNILTGKKVPVYGTGLNIRDWVYVKDHVLAIDMIFHQSVVGETYCVGGNLELSNLKIVRKIIENINSMFSTPKYHEMKIIEFVEDRKGHDFRYAINHNKLNYDIGWEPHTPFEYGMSETIKYYMGKI